MGKKKRQGEPNTNNSDESTESCDENQNMVECTHISKAVDLQRIKKTIQKTDFLMECEECKNSPSNELEMDADYEFDLSLWMCLKCGHQGCGRSKKQHALQHFNTPRSDCHALCVNTTVWSVWCYSCDNEVNVTCKKKLLESIEYLKKHSENSKHKSEPSIATIEDKTIDIIHTMNNSEFGAKGNGNQVNLPRIRGLTNLGNTCFFNSVMQCLGQTPYLLNLLEETSHSGQYFQLPGGKLSVSDKESIVLEPLDGTLEEWWPLTRILAQTLEELQCGRPEVYNPHMLFGRLTQRMPQFAGGQQHDSHELLRHLLEAVREEDLRRYQAVILEKLGLSRKTDPSSVEGDKKKIIKFYGQQASELLLPTEQVFRGTLVSMLQCQDCKHTSRRDEFFLDLSLPISEKQLPPILRRKAEESDENKPSKHQIKKEKRAAAKKNKKQKNHRCDIISNDSFSMDNSGTDSKKEMDNNSDSESDADVEDNIEQENSLNVGSSQSKENIPKGTESGYNSDKIDNGSPDSNNGDGSPDMRIDDSGVPSPAVGMLSVSPLAPNSPENSPASSETNIDMGSPLCGHNSPTEENNEDYDRPVSRLSFVNNKNIDLKADLEKLSLFNDADSKQSKSLFSLQDDNKQNIKTLCDGAYGGYDDAEDEKMDEDGDADIWGVSTMSARYQCEEGECSVQSCLNQFTACELLTGNNKVGCDLCTKRHGSGGENNKKTVYTNATKQLLVCNPPAVLILHLKRFQVLRFRSAKVNKFVTFPTLLDLAPFCSKRCHNLPTFETGQTEVLYALYGVVEHSGSIHGGHYVAYVKVRSRLENDSYRWQFLPKNQKDNNQEENVRGARATPEVPPGKWYYVSDSYVTEVSESKVLKAQAYLLFYERIL